MTKIILTNATVEIRHILSGVVSYRTEHLADFNGKRDRNFATMDEALAHVDDEAKRGRVSLIVAMREGDDMGVTIGEAKPRLGPAPKIEAAIEDAPPVEAPKPKAKRAPKAAAVVETPIVADAVTPLAWGLAGKGKTIHLADGARSLCGRDLSLGKGVPAGAMCKACEKKAAALTCDAPAKAKRVAKPKAEPKAKAAPKAKAEANDTGVANYIAAITRFVDEEIVPDVIIARLGEDKSMRAADVQAVCKAIFGTKGKSKTDALACLARFVNDKRVEFADVRRAA